MSSKHHTQRPTIFEFFPIGSYVRVRAMDTTTLEEITITGAKTASQQQLKNAAYQRLQYVLKKKGIIDSA